MPHLLDKLTTIQTTVNSAAPDLASLEILPSQSKKKSNAKKILADAQVQIGKLINDLG